MDFVTFIFSSRAEPLGYVLTRDDVLVHVELTSIGRMCLGSECEKWQTHGIPVLRHYLTATSDGLLSQFAASRVSVDAHSFLSAFRHWAGVHEFRLLSASPETLPCWKRMLQLPFESEERFALMCAFRRLSADDLRRWENTLDEAKEAVDRVV